MSGTGTSELLLLFVIGLLVLGPERLPRAASQVGRWVGRARREANRLRRQLESETALSERRRMPPDDLQPEDRAADGVQAVAVGQAGPEADVGTPRQGSSSEVVDTTRPTQ
jgi:sec-independent protein translocase protein TatB